MAEALLDPGKVAQAADGPAGWNFAV